jgi:hypothetical protein
VLICAHEIDEERKAGAAVRHIDELNNLVPTLLQLINFVLELFCVLLRLKQRFDLALVFLNLVFEDTVLLVSEVAF